MDFHIADTFTYSLARAGLPFKTLNDCVETTHSQVSVNLAKGLEFRAVSVMACDYKVIPPQL